MRLRSRMSIPQEKSQYILSNRQMTKRFIRRWNIVEFRYFMITTTTRSTDNIDSRLTLSLFLYLPTTTFSSIMSLFASRQPRQGRAFMNLFYCIYMSYRRFVLHAISSSYANSASSSSERGARNSAMSKGLRMNTRSSEVTRES
jgi:hypothetical protein